MYVCVRNLLTSGRASIHSVYLCSLFLYAQIVNFARGERERESSEQERSCTGCCLFTPRATTTTNLDYLLSRDRNRFSNTHSSHCLAPVQTPTRLFSARQYRHTDFFFLPARSFVRVSSASPCRCDKKINGETNVHLLSVVQQHAKVRCSQLFCLFTIDVLPHPMSNCFLQMTATHRQISMATGELILIRVILHLRSS